MKLEYTALYIAALTAIFSGQLMLIIFLMGFILVWNDAKWPAFDSDDYDKKMMNGPLKPWQKGN